MKNKSVSKSKSIGSKAHQNHNQTHQPTENAWNRSRHSSVSSMWSDADEHFPVLGASAPPEPTINVWEERKSKQEAIKALEPQNEYDEEAMLQHALTLSLLEATEEEEKRKRVQEDYEKQLEALKHYPEDSEEFYDVDELMVGSASELKDDLSVVEQHQLKDSSKSSTLNKKEKDIYDCEDSELGVDFPAGNQHHSENYSRNSIQTSCQKGKTYSSGGARPKVSKAIEAFGGWGLKESKKRNHPENISKFLDDVVSEKPVEKFNKTSHNQTNKYANKEIVNSNEESSMHNSNEKNAVTPIAVENRADKDEIFYNEKGTFLDDYDGNWNDSPKNEADNFPKVSSNTVLDTWLCSEDVADENKEFLNEVPTLNDKISDNFTTPTFSDKPKIEDDRNKICSPIPTILNDYEPEVIKNSQIFSQCSSESLKNVWSNTANYKDQELPETEDSSKYSPCDLNANNFTPFNEPTEVPTLTSSKVWSDKSSGSSSYFGSFSENLASKVESIRINSDVDNDVFKGVSLSNDSDVPPIPPPQPVGAVSTVNECSVSAAVNSDGGCNLESPPVPQPQAIPQIPVSPFPALGNPILNPLFPALTPMLGCGMDPLLMRRMLILTNPFLANQLLAMEQYYRSMGVPVDLFCMTNPMANMPGVLNPSHLQNSFAGNANSNIQQLQSEIQLLQAKINESSASVNENLIEKHEQKSSGVSHQPSGIDPVFDFNNSSTSEGHCSENPWYKSYLSNNDASIIPPPKPPPSEINCNNVMPIPRKSESSLGASGFDNKLAHSFPSQSPNNISSNSIKKPFETCSTVKENSGWSDTEDEIVDAQNLKSHTWADGWRQKPISAPKPPSIQEEKKKTVFRQPAKQPQIGRYQRNSTYS